MGRELNYGPWDEETFLPSDIAMRKNKIKKYNSVNRYLDFSESKGPSNLLTKHRTLSIRRYPEPPEK
jgi:hypothetical protein